MYWKPSNTSDVNNPYLFTGRRYDNETGLYYYRARYYDYATGRFLQSDPLLYIDGLNLYSYVRNNPIMFVDPSGMIVELDGIHEATIEVLKMTIAHLMEKSSVFKKAYQALDAHKKTYTIYAGELCKPDLDLFDSVIYWNVHLGAKFVVWDWGPEFYGLLDPILGYQSQATILAHEIMHALEKATNSETFDKNWYTYDPYYDNKEELRVIPDLEAQIAEALGEDRRYSHEATLYYTELDYLQDAPALYISDENEFYSMLKLLEKLKGNK